MTGNDVPMPLAGIRQLSVAVSIANVDPFYKDSFQTTKFTEEYAHFKEVAAPRPFLGEAIEYPIPRSQGFYTLIDPSIVLTTSKSEQQQEERARRLSKSSAKYQRAGFIGLAQLGLMKISDIITKAIPVALRGDVGSADFIERFSSESVALNFRKNAPRYAKAIAIGKMGNDWVVELPVMEESVGAMVKDHMRTSLMYDDMIEVHQSVTSAFASMGLRLGNPGHTSSVVPIAAFKPEVSAVYDESRAVVNTLINNGYLKGFKFEMGYNPNETDAANSKLNRFLANGIGDVTAELVGDKTVDAGLKVEVTSKGLEGMSSASGESAYDLFERLGSRTITIYARFVVPAEEIAYFVQTPADKIRPSYVHFFFNNYYMRGATRFPSKVKEKKGKATSEDAKLLKVRNKARDAYGAARFISPISRIVSASSQYTAKPRVDENFLCVNQDNTCYFIPEVNEVDKYELDMDDLLADEDGMFRTWHKGLGSSNLSGTPDKIRLLKDSKGFTPNKLIFSDWVNNKLIYTNAEGNLDALDLEMAYKLRPMTTIQILTSEVKTYEAGNLTYPACLCIIAQRWMMANGKSIREYFDRHASDIKDEVAKFANNYRLRESDFGRQVLRSFSMNTTKDYYNMVVTFLDMVDLEFLNSHKIEYRDITPNSRLAMLRPFGEILRDAAADAKANPREFVEMLDSDIQHACIQMGRFMTIAAYAEQYESQYNAVRQEMQTYQDQERSFKPNTFTPEFHCVTDKAMLPHQVKAAYRLKDTPEFAVLAVDAGGGKTMMIITNILQEIAKGNIKRPLVCCPSYLVKDYVAECAYFTEGKVNAIVIDNSTLRNLGHEKMKQIVDSAPPNTLYITAYNTLTVGQEVVNYAGSEFVLGEHINFMRSLNFDGIWFDESHFLKARNSRRSIAARYLSSEIPMKRLATGTFMPNRPFDLVKQFSFFYPGVFGSIDQFQEAFMNGRVMKSGSASEVGFRLHSSCQFIHIRRIEWIANLPPKRETLHPVELTAKQKYVYRAIFDETIQKLAQDKGLVNILAKSGGSNDEDDDDDTTEADDADDNEIDSGDDADADDPEMFEKLDKHLAAIESFLANPRANAWSKEFQLSDAEMISPKGLKIAEICEDHINQGIQGKILVATNWSASRDGIYEAFPDWLKKRFIVYHASQKMTCIDKFRNDPNIIGMIGIAKSLETGHNFQFCSRLIRSENVWDPGSFEQFLARAFRPSIKEKDMRKPENGGKGVFIDTIVADDTIDVLKAAKLISKQIILSKIYNYDNPMYQELPDIPEVAASFENLKEFSSWEALEQYAEARKLLLSIERAEAVRWKEEHTDETEPVAIKDLGILPGSKIIKHVPYTPGMQIFNSDELNLKPLNYYLSKETSLNPDFDPVGQPVHTMYGDGIIHRISADRVQVYLNGVGKVTTGLNRESVFAITKKATDSKEVKDKIVNFISATVGIDKVVDIPFDPPVSDRGSKGIERRLQKEQDRIQKEAEREAKKNIRDVTKKRQVPTPTTDLELNQSVDGFVEVVNKTLCLVVSADDPDVTDKIMRRNGLQLTKPYLYAHVKTRAGYDKMLEILDQYDYDDEGNPVAKPESRVKFRMKNKYANMLIELYNEFTFNGTSRKLVVEQKTKTDIGNFLRTTFRVITDPKEVRPYPLISEGSLFICFDLASHKTNFKKLQKLVIPGIRWGIQDGDYREFFNSKRDLSATIEGLKTDGISFNNEDEMREKFRNITFKGKRT